VLGVLLVLVGAVWIGQGFGYIKGSFMTGQILWAEIGVLCLVAGSAVVGFSFLAGRRRLP
jgi:hypothetical protein